MDFLLTQARKLSTKQELFIAAYLGVSQGNAREAARQAGYKHAETSAKANMRNPLILERIKDFVEKKFATADEVLGKLTEIAMAPSFEFIEVISRNEEGDPIRVRMDLKDQVKSLELLGKHHQLFTDNVKHSGRVDHVVRNPDLSQLTADELDSLEQLAQRVGVELDQ